MTDINPTTLAHTHSTPSAASALIGDPSQFGRVGEDGTVFVRTSEGEKPVGSYPGKSAEEALAYFVRKFEALASEVALTAARITSGAMVPQDAYEAVKKLRQQVRELNGVGDLDALAQSVEQIEPLIEGHREAYEAKKAAETAVKAARREQILVEKEKIVAEAESLALSENWKVTGDRLKSLLDEWKAAPRLDKKADADFWKRFSASRNKFDKRRRTHFAQLEATTSKVTEAKTAIIDEAEKLATSTDWVATARRFKVLMDSWKAAGRGKKSDDAKNWARFKAAQDQFFASKNADLEKREVSMTANLAKREELILQIEALIPFTDAKTAKNSFRELMRSWEKIGITHRDKRASFDARVEKVEAEIKAAEAEVWRKTDPAAKARAAEVVAQLTESVENYSKIAAKAQSAGNDKKAKEALESAEARKVWLTEAEKTLAEFN
jgi:predicted transposase YbfD/YdcC